MLTSAVCIYYLRPIISIPFLVPKDYNEGYYAQLALHAFGAGPLYPDRDSLIANGYPPLYFYLLAAAGSLVGDHIIAGRCLALLGLVISCLGVGAVVHLLTRSLAVAAFAGLFLAAFIGLNHPHYVAMNDPQWIAQALVVAGLLVFLTWGETTAGLAAVVILLLAAGLTKQTVAALPLAITVSLWAYRRRAAYVWLLLSASLAGLSLAALYGVYGPTFFLNLLFVESNREFSFAKIMAIARTLLWPFAPLVLGLVAYIALEPRGPVKLVLLAYAALAAAIGILFVGGSFVDWNHLYDLVIALVVTMALAIHRAGERLVGHWQTSPVSPVLALLASVGLLLPAPAQFAEARTARVSLAEREPRVAIDVAYLAAQSGPALCETMALCYWAKKPHEADILELRRKLLSGKMNEQQFRALIDSGHFSVLQFHSEGSSGRTKRLPPGANDYILKRYESRPNAMGGSFLLPQRRSN